LSESEDRTVAAALDPHGVEAYAEAVWAETSAWLEAIEPVELARVPDVTAGLERLGVDLGEYDWLDRMWADKPVGFHVQWEATGHGYLHLGEMVHLRNEMQ
jgi:hypothetical protein